MVSACKLRVGLVIAALAAAPSFLAASAPALVTVYKSPTCGCCKAWVRHMQENGFAVEAHDVNDVTPYKKRYGVRSELASCHTAVIGGYVFEGHVPAEDIKRFLNERPASRGLAVPGMPQGSPGMEGPRAEPYNVLSLDADGIVQVSANH